MPTFITLTGEGGIRKIQVNVDAIDMFERGEIYHNTLIVFSNQTTQRVLETPEQIMSILDNYKTNDFVNKAVIERDLNNR